jgi:aldose 1-epimerase
MPALPTVPFGRTADGTQAAVYTLENDHLRVRITNWGGRMVSIEAPDKSGQKAHVLLGFDDVGAFQKNGGSFGALLGRVANRIAGASFELDGQTFQLARSEGNATLHGGVLGFNKMFWTVVDARDGALTLTHVSPDGDQGFPGELSAEATYRLRGETLTLSLTARTTKPTIVNLSAHPYFNLAGGGDVLGHHLMVPAEAFLPTDAASIPTGEVRSVAGTRFDFRVPTPLGARIWEPDEQLFHGLGYDHCFVLSLDAPTEPRLAARLSDPGSGRMLEIYTDQPGIQVYSGNKLAGAFAGHGGVVYRQSAGVALEAQALPDAPHHPGFPSIVLRPGETYRRVIKYRFTAS